jgi:exopolyphosphatase / guanosine-5'-triphosphate,3'-diphosphate pyrophosphatase
MRIAVIDLGTNTCNLLIAELNGTGFKIMYQGKEHVKLLHNKKSDNWIREDAFSRASAALSNHLKKINDFSVRKINLIATSAVREAANRDEFLDFIRSKTDLEANVVTGEQEAELIYHGVLLAFKDIVEPSLILDIGGGSNEFIIARNHEIIWKESGPAGMSRTVNLFEISDPITPEEIAELRQFFQIQNMDAIRYGKKALVSTLIGCSGAFDTIADMVDKVDPGTKRRIKQKIEPYDLRKVYEKIIRSTHLERRAMKGMDPVRIDLIVPAIIMINHIVTDLGIEKIYQTDFALREGVLFNLLNSSLV